MKSLIFILFVVLASLSNIELKADPDKKAQEEINYLLDFIKNSNVVFIRNGKEYTSKDAYEHLGKKLEHFRKVISTTELFIEKCATKSEMSGKEYQIKVDEKTQISSAAFLMAELKKFRETKKEAKDENKTEPQK